MIPKWFAGILAGGPVYIHGDGETSRDFCYIDNCVQANILTATTENPDAPVQVYNVAFGRRTTLNQLFQSIQALVVKTKPEAAAVKPIDRDFRPGDVRHSLADIGKAEKLLGYQPHFSVRDGLELAAKWYL